MGHQQGYVLLVGEAPEALAPSLSGYKQVRTCAGPKGDCPAEVGLRCGLRDEAEATVVYLAGEHEFHGHGLWDCVAASPSPVAVGIAGATHLPRGGNGFALFGSTRGVSGALEAIDVLIGHDSEPGGDEG